MEVYIGIDPGKGGGIALIYSNGDVVTHKMPATDMDLLMVFPPYRGETGVKPYAYLERVHSSPGMGVVSAFTFGRGYGALCMALTAAKIPFDEVRPQAWQKAMNCLTKGDKNVTKRRAQQLFPDLKITHALADALLIAEYGRRIRERVVP